jgi:hypothetical protein
MSFSEVLMSRDAGIDYGGYDNDGSAGMSSAQFLEDRIEAFRFESAIPGAGSGVGWPERLAQFGVPALMDAAARTVEAQARADIARAGQQNGSFAGPNGRTQVPPQVGVGLGGGVAGGMGGTGGLLMLAAVGALLFVALRD